ncbi:MAG: ABC transporter permease [Alphaproteobacteria bacterium]|nr:ABC transporter permease [Alphaproteobacteria bacterium]
MFDWLSVHRADFAAVLILLLVVAFVASIYKGVHYSILRKNDEVFGDPERTKGGWYWAVTGVSTILLLWFFFSWGMARAYFPNAANEMCQIAKIEEAISPIKARLPIGSRYYKSTILVVRNAQQLETLEENIPSAVFSASELRQIDTALAQTNSLINILSDPSKQSEDTRQALAQITADIEAIGERLDQGYDGLEVSEEGRNQPRWGVTDTEIPLIPMTARGMMFDEVSVQAKDITTAFLKLRNLPDDAKTTIASTKAILADLKDAAKDSSGWTEADVAERGRFIKALDRIFKRLDDGIIFPSEALAGVNSSIETLYDKIDDAQGSLGIVDALFFPGHGVVKSKTLCIEQGSSRWLPKPFDVVAKFGKLANPDLENGGGYKGTTLLWWKWLPIADVVDFIIPDMLVDALPGSYGTHGDDGSFMPTYKDKVLAFAQGDVYLGSIPMLDGHIWDSLFRVIVAMAFGICLGVPLGIYMGVSRFFKSFFDPMIELYRPVPPLAWAPLILTIFGIQDDGKIFLLFMVAFAIMVISARTGASGTQLSKIRASHSLGASNQQILRNVILPNALPEILTGIRIAIGVCWGTLVAAEMLAGTTGIGFIENVARTVSDYELIWVTILVMGLLGLMFDLIMRKVISITIPWRGKG